MSPQKSANSEKVFHGVPASPGIAIGKIFSIGGNVLDVEPRTIDESEIKSELERYHQALQKAKSELDGLVKKSKRSLSKESAKIFQVHQTMLDDPMVIEGTEKGIREKRKSADHAFKDVMERFEAQVAEMEDEYFRARAADLYDLKCRVIRHIQGHHPVYFNRLKEPAVIFAKELTPSDTVSLETDKVLGFAHGLWRADFTCHYCRAFHECTRCCGAAQRR
ncbi:MAG: phosphoenolpyruvate-utilizing N-terminal domain-containing protein [candidate division KSB1 bacterium]|nr:phosphoenolpyruvate-utilizing N-terminal domain-containing protein [candidate division KSB1 bacterium]